MIYISHVLVHVYTPFKRVQRLHHFIGHNWVWGHVP